MYVLLENKYYHNFFVLQASHNDRLIPVYTEKAEYILWNKFVCSFEYITALSYRYKVIHVMASLYI